MDAWTQVILLPDEPDVDEHGMETPCDIPPVVENLLKYFISPEMQGEFSYGCKAVVCEDKTKFPKRQVDRAFLDVPRSFQKKMLKLKYQIQC